MAKPLGYTPPTPADTAADDEVDDLVLALHQSGLLRAATGAVRAYPQLLGSLLSVVSADAARSTITLASALRGLDPEQSERLAAGIRRAGSAAAEAIDGDSEGPLALLRRLRDPDTRRGISAALAALSAIGAALREDPPAT